jgi:hypothetical protein
MLQKSKLTIKILHVMLAEISTFAILYQMRRMRYHWKGIEIVIPMVVHSPDLVKNCKSYGSSKFQPSRELKL